LQDSFTRCFKSNPPEPWNWNIYLFPLYCFGVVVRYCILFPLRLVPLIYSIIYGSYPLQSSKLDLHVCTEQFHCFKTCRCFTLAFGWIIFLSLFIPVNALLKGQDRLRKKIEVGWILSFVLYNFVFTMLFRYSSI